MSRYDSLVGQAFVRNGIRHTVVKCHGVTVVAAVLHGDRVQRVFVPLAHVLESLEVTEIMLTELPRDGGPGPGRHRVEPGSSEAGRAGDLRD